MKTKFQIEQINTMLKHLSMAMKYCNMYADLKELVYDPENEIVNAYYWGFMKSDNTRELYKKDINVACDSYAAMIHDVEQACYKFFS